jgi:hypothetical protein
MQSAPLSHSLFPAVWRDVLERMEQALAEVEADAATREQALQAPPAAPSSVPERLAALVQQLAPAETWLEPLHATVRQAEQLVQETNAVLRSEEIAINDWLKEVGAVRERLAQWDTARAHGDRI